VWLRCHALRVDARLLLLLAGWLAGWYLLWRVPTLAVAAGRGRPDQPADLAIVVPARDEADNLPVLLGSLAAQSVAPTEVIVVDDHSSDDTAAVAAAFAGVRVVSATVLPPGWTGKAWACQQGVEASSTGRVLLLDADVTLAPGAVGALLSAHDRHGGLLSVQPWHHMERAYERLSALCNVVGEMGVGMASPWRHGRARAAFGPCLVTSRADYDAVGGHESVRGEIIEDIALGRCYADAGLPVHALGGASLVSFRMYPAGLRQLVEGWSKNMASGAGSTPIARFALIALWITALLSGIGLSLDVARGVPGSSVVVAGGVWAAFAVQLWAMLRQIGSFGVATAVLYPVVVVAFVAIFTRSLWLSVVRREVAWRGRPIPLGREARWAGASGDGGRT